MLNSWVFSHGLANSNAQNALTQEMSPDMKPLNFISKVLSNSNHDTWAIYLYSLIVECVNTKYMVGLRPTTTSVKVKQKYMTTNPTTEKEQ